MSEPDKEQNPTKLDSTSAAAALALAVTSAEKLGEKPTTTEPPKTSAGARIKWPSMPAEWRTHAVLAAAVASAIGLGWAGGSQAVSGGKPAQAMPEWVETATTSIRQNQEDLVRLSGDMRVLKGIVESVKESFDQATAETAGRERSLMERIEGIERTAQEVTAKIAHVVDASDRIERATTDAGAKLAVVSGRLDDIERRAAAAKPAPAASAAETPSQTGSVPRKTATKVTTVEGWVLREVYDGAALVESRNGYLREVVPGSRLPSVGRVEAIERRGRTWVVVTSKGIIGAPQRWH
jgi:hypothetical protein